MKTDSIQEVIGKCIPGHLANNRESLMDINIITQRFPSKPYKTA